MSNLSRSQLDGPVNDREIWNEKRRRIGMDGIKYGGMDESLWK